MNWDYLLEWLAKEKEHLTSHDSPGKKGLRYSINVIKLWCKSVVHEKVGVRKYPRMWNTAVRVKLAKFTYIVSDDCRLLATLIEMHRLNSINNVSDIHVFTIFDSYCIFCPLKIIHNCIKRNSNIKYWYVLQGCYIVTFTTMSYKLAYVHSIQKSNDFLISFF